MADDKKDRGGESSGETKKGSASGTNKGFFQKFLEPIFDQITTEYTRPALRNIPPSVLSGLKKIGAGKVLPIFSVILSGLLQQKETWWGERAGDIIAESSAELRRLIDEYGEGDTTTSEGPKESNKIKNGLLSVLLNPELVDELEKLLAALATTVQAQDTEKEKNQLLAMLNSMGLQAVDFLSLEENERKILISVFFTKAKEKSLEESIKELKANIQKTKAEWQVINNELLQPTWAAVKPKLEIVGNELKKFDEQFALDAPATPGGTTLGNWAVDFRQQAEAFRDRQRRK